MPSLVLTVGGEEYPGELGSFCYEDSNEGGCATGVPVDPPEVLIPDARMSLPFMWTGPPAQMAVALCRGDDLYTCKKVQSDQFELPGANWSPSGVRGTLRLSASVTGDQGSAEYAWLIQH